MDGNGNKRVESRIESPPALAAEARRLSDLWGEFARSRVPVAADCSCCPPGQSNEPMFIDGAEFEQDILDFLEETFMATRNIEARVLLRDKGSYKPGESGSLSAFLLAIAEIEDRPGARPGPWPVVVDDLAKTIESLASFR